MKQLLHLIFVALIGVLSINVTVQAQDWKKIRDPKVLKQIHKDTILIGMPWATSNLDYYHLGTNWQIISCADGTGVVSFSDSETLRIWEIVGNDTVCISTTAGVKCYFCEENMKYEGIFKCGVVGQKEGIWAFSVTKNKPDICL